MQKNKILLTEGNIYESLIKFSVPFIIANLLQALYGAVDMFIIGIFTDTAGLSGVAVATQVMQIVNGIILGLTMGGTILVGQYYGANRQSDTEKTIGSLMIIGTFVSLIITVSMFIFKDGLLNLLNTPAEAYIDAKNYVLITSAGTVFIFGYNAVSAVLRGLGDSKRPVYFIAIACIVNIILDLLFVANLGLRASGAAFATVISQLLSLIIAIWYLTRRSNYFKFTTENLRVDLNRIWDILKISLPLAFQEVLLWGSFLVIAAIANGMGVNASAAVGIVAKFETFSMLPPMALSYAIAAMTAQNIGADKPERALKALKISIAMSLVTAFLFLLWAQLHPHSIMAIFGADLGVAIAGAQYLKFYSIDFLLVSFKFNLNGFLNGSGRTTFAMFNGIFSSIFIRIPLAYILGVKLAKGLYGLGLSVTLASILSITFSILFIRTGKWREKIIK